MCCAACNTTSDTENITSIKFQAERCICFLTFYEFGPLSLLVGLTENIMIRCADSVPNLTLKVFYCTAKAWESIESTHLPEDFKKGIVDTQKTT